MYFTRKITVTRYFFKRKTNNVDDRYEISGTLLVYYSYYFLVTATVSRIVLRQFDTTRQFSSLSASSALHNQSPSIGPTKLHVPGRVA